MNKTTAIIIALCILVLAFVAFFSVFRKRGKGKINGPWGMGIEVEGSNEPASQRKEQIENFPISPEFLGSTKADLFRPNAETTEKLHRCSKCEYGFKIMNPVFYASDAGGSPTATCPNCGNIDPIN